MTVTMPSSSTTERRSPDVRVERGSERLRSTWPEGATGVVIHPSRFRHNRRPRHAGPRPRNLPARQQSEPSSPDLGPGRPPKRPKTPLTGLVGANHVKAPPPPLYTFEGLIEFKQLAPKKPHRARSGHVPCV